MAYFKSINSQMTVIYIHFECRTESSIMCCCFSKAVYLCPFPLIFQPGPNPSSVYVNFKLHKIISNSNPSATFFFVWGEKPNSSNVIKSANSLKSIKIIYFLHQFINSTRTNSLQIFLIKFCNHKKNWILIQVLNLMRILIVACDWTSFCFIQWCSSVTDFTKHPPYTTHTGQCLTNTRGIHRSELP